MKKCTFGNHNKLVTELQTKKLFTCNSEKRQQQIRVRQSYRGKKKNIEGAPYKVNVIGQCCKMAICTLGNKPKKCKGTKLSNEFSRKANRKILNTL